MCVGNHAFSMCIKYIFHLTYPTHSQQYKIVYMYKYIYSIIVYILFLRTIKIDRFKIGLWLWL